MFKLSTTLRHLRSNAIQPFVLPIPTSPSIRVAQLGDGPAFAGIKPFKVEGRIGLEAYRPQIIVAHAKEMRMLAEQVDLRMLDLSSVDHAAIVVTECGGEPLSDVTRVLLWQVFGVPVFEIFTGRDRTVLAAECELHEGWHLEAGVRLQWLDGEIVLDARGTAGLHTGLTGRMDVEACPCGRTTPRLVNIKPVARAAKSTRLAAIA